MPFVPVHKGSVHYKVDGEGPGLVLVHGTGGDAETVFGHVVDRLGAGRTTIRPNLSGSGQTSDSGDQLGVEQLVDQVAAAIRDGSERAGVAGPVDVVGFSLGAVIAAATAALHPGLVRRLVLLAGWAHTTGARDQFYFETWRDLFAADRELFKRFTALTGYSSAALDEFGHEGLAGYLAKEWPSPGMGRQIELGLRVDIRDLLPKIEAPTLVIGLEQDAMVPVDGSRQLHAGIRDSRLVELDGEGHMDWFVRPGRILEHISQFL